MHDTHTFPAPIVEAGTGWAMSVLMTGSRGHYAGIRKDNGPPYEISVNSHHGLPVFRICRDRRACGGVWISPP
jgi:hypothetical protein